MRKRCITVTSLFLQDRHECDETDKAADMKFEIYMAVEPVFRTLAYEAQE